MLCWGESHGSAIHDHANSHCFVKVLNGELKETRFAWPNQSEPEDQMKKIGEETYGRDGVTYMCGKLIQNAQQNDHGFLSECCTNKSIDSMVNKCPKIPEKIDLPNIRNMPYSKLSNRLKMIPKT